MSNEPTTDSSAPLDQNDPAHWHRRIEELEQELTAAKDAESAARGESAYHQLLVGQSDQPLLDNLARASAHVSSVEAAIDLAKVKRDAAELYQRHQKALSIYKTAEDYAEEFKRATAKVEKAVADLAKWYQQAFNAGHGVAVCITKAKQLIPPESRQDARVFAGDSRQSLSVPAHFNERVQIEIYRHLGRLWPSCPEFSPVRLNAALHEAHDEIVRNALAEVRAYLNLEA